MRRLERAIFDRIEAEVCFALLAEGFPFRAQAPLLERLRISQPAQQQAGSIRSDQPVEKLRIQAPAL